MISMETQRLMPDSAGLDVAAALLRDGGLVAFPTETVYGLGADATSDESVAKIFAAKGRPSFNPLIVHVPDLEAAQKLADFDDVALRLADAFWPGALTLLLPKRPEAGISRLVTAGSDWLAVRVPQSDLAISLLRRVGRPIAAPSANPSGRISPTTADHVLGGLAGRIEAVLDGGACEVGVESTIVSTGVDCAILRAGGIPAEAISRCVGRPVTFADNPAHPVAPGQLLSHYAPSGTVRLNADAPREDEVLLGFGSVEATINLSPSGDLLEAAARLFDALHQLDKSGAKAIAVSPIPNHGLGRAINDRLSRAAAPREETHAK